MKCLPWPLPTKYLNFDNDSAPAGIYTQNAGPPVGLQWVILEAYLASVAVANAKVLFFHHFGFSTGQPAVGNQLQIYQAGNDSLGAHVFVGGVSSVRTAGGTDTVVPGKRTHLVQYPDGVMARVIALVGVTAVAYRMRVVEVPLDVDVSSILI